MQQFKDLFAVIDVFVGAFWSFTMFDIIPIVLAGKVTTDLFSSVSGIVNLCLAIAGLIYLIIRLLHFIKISKVNLEIRKQDLISKKQDNFYNKFNHEFNEPFIDKKTKK